jgi:hypothetical protein
MYHHAPDGYTCPFCSIVKGNNDRYTHQNDLISFRLTLTQLAREILAMMTQPGYLPLVRMIIAESPRFPQLGSLFFSTVTERGMGMLTRLITEAHQQGIVADVDFDAVMHALLGGLLTFGMMNLVLGEDVYPVSLDGIGAVVGVLMPALTP